MASLFRPVPSWPPPMAAPPVRRGGLRHHLIVAGGLLTLVFLLGMLRDPGLGLLVVALAWAVGCLLGRHRGEGGGRQAWRAALEYVVVGALVVAVALATPTPTPTPPPKAKAKAEQVQPDPWADLGAQLAKLRERLPKDLPRVEVATNKEGR